MQKESLNYWFNKLTLLVNDLLISDSNTEVCCRLYEIGFSKEDLVELGLPESDITKAKEKYFKSSF